MFHRPLVAAFAAALLLASPALAAQSAESAFVGSWTFDAAQSDLAGGDWKIILSADGRMDSFGGSTAHYVFAIDGQDNLTENGRLVAWTETGPNAWRMTKKRDGVLAETAEVTLSADGQSLTTVVTGKLPDQSDFRRTTVYRRQGQDQRVGLPGVWRAVSVDTGDTYDGYIISAAPDGVMTWKIPTDHQVIVGKFDGSDLKIQGPGLPPGGATLAVRVVSPRQLSFTMKTEGKISQHGAVTVSPDGRTLTELFWEPGQEAHPSKGVYVREP
jgi:hypothetical protein